MFFYQSDKSAAPGWDNFVSCSYMVSIDGTKLLFSMKSIKLSFTTRPDRRRLKPVTMRHCHFGDCCTGINALGPMPVA
jgi:hypothetical protein